MMSTSHNEQDMETLSALFDGELQGDAARFAMKRLDHDVRWQQAFGNWQLLGDALRGQASMVAPSGFATRVAVAIAAEPVPTAASAAPATAVSTATGAPARRKWMGGAALAASVAMVAMFVARPFSQDPGTGPGAASPAPTELAATPAPAPAVPAPTRPSAPDAAIEAGAVALAVAEVPRRASERRSRGQSQRAALRAQKRQSATPAIARAGTTTAIAVADSQPPHSPANPFHPAQSEAVSRPWPRAVLPAAAATGSFTASYGGGSAGSPSFYPFEPRLPTTSDGAPAARVDDVQP